MDFDKYGKHRPKSIETGVLFQEKLQRTNMAIRDITVAGKVIFILLRRFLDTLLGMAV